MHFLDLVLWFVFVVWIAAGIFAFWNFIGVVVLRPRPSPAPQATQRSFPRVSILLAARNEQDMLPATLDSLLKLDYPDFEIILVNDDSDDRTGAIADEWAQREGARGALRPGTETGVAQHDQQPMCVFDFDAEASSIRLLGARRGSALCDRYGAVRTPRQRRSCPRRRPCSRPVSGEFPLILIIIEHSTGPSHPL